MNKKCSFEIKKPTVSYIFCDMLKIYNPIPEK
jgi:hypothetical protein